MKPQKLRPEKVVSRHLLLGFIGGIVFTSLFLLPARWSAPVALTQPAPLWVSPAPRQPAQLAPQSGMAAPRQPAQLTPQSEMEHAPAPAPPPAPPAAAVAVAAAAAAAYAAAAAPAAMPPPVTVPPPAAVAPAALASVLPCTSSALAVIDTRLASVLANTHPELGDGDIACNLPLVESWLRKAQPAHVTEIGVRWGVSSWAFARYAAERAAAGLPAAYVASDITKKDTVAQLDAAMVGCPGVAYSFVEGDDLELPAWDTDFLFIDTWHTYKQLFRELDRWAPRTRSVLVLHDTATFGQVDEGTEGHGGKPVNASLFEGVAQKTGLVAAYRDFLATPAGDRWEVVEENGACNGITFLRAKGTP
jgi:hypothetical protein